MRHQIEPEEEGDKTGLEVISPAGIREWRNWQESGSYHLRLRASHKEWT